jgi:hypothetical protein
MAPLYQPGLTDSSGVWCDRVGPPGLHTACRRRTDTSVTLEIF